MANIEISVFDGSLRLGNVPYLPMIGLRTHGDCGDLTTRLKRRQTRVCGERCPPETWSERNDRFGRITLGLSPRSLKRPSMGLPDGPEISLETEQENLDEVNLGDQNAEVPPSLLFIGS